MTAPTETTLLCRAATCGYAQAAGARLCALHREETGQHLAVLGDLYEALDAVPSLQGREPGTGGSGSLAAHRSVGNLDVMVLRDKRSQARREDDSEGNAGRGVLQILAYWGGAVRQARNIPTRTRQLPPVRVTGGFEGPVCAHWCAHDTCRTGTLRGTAPIRQTVRTERKLLSDQLDWILNQDAAGQFHDDIRDVWLLLRSATGAQITNTRRFLTPCPQCQVKALVATMNSPTVTCRSCGHTTALPQLTAA